MERVFSGWNLRPRPHTRAGLEQMGRTIAAYFCLAVGTVGLVLPIIPGVPLLIAGVALLKPEHPVRRFATRWIPRRTEKSK